MPTREQMLEKAKEKTELANLAMSRREAWERLLRACTMLQLAYSQQEDLIEDFLEVRKELQVLSTKRYESLKSIEEKARSQARMQMDLYDNTPAF